MSATYIGHVDDGVVLGFRVEFFTTGILNTSNVAGIFHNSELHTEADTQERNLLGTSPSDGLDHTCGRTIAETARNANYEEV